MIYQILKLTIIQNDGNRYRLNNGQYVAIDVMHKNCEFPLDMLDEDGRIKNGSDVMFAEMKNGRIYPSHDHYHKRKTQNAYPKTVVAEKSQPTNSMEISPYANCPESDDLEYKSSFAETDKVIKTLAAFRNSKVAGTVVIGVDNNGLIVCKKLSPQEQADKVAQFLNTTTQKCKCLKDEVSCQWNADGTCHIQIRKSFDDKIAYINGNSLYIRNGARNCLLKDEELTEFVRNKHYNNIKN